MPHFIEDCPRFFSSMAKESKSTPARIADNKKAAFNYFFEEKYEAGMALEGWEVKAIREGKADRKSTRLNSSH